MPNRRVEDHSTPSMCKCNTPQNSITIQFEARPKLQEFEMAIHPIYRRRLSNLEITVWNARNGYEEDLSVKIANRHRSTKPFSTFSLKDLQAASLLIQGRHRNVRTIVPEDRS